jgi:hypothetical protein
LEGLAELSQWKAIAIADFYASTTRFRGRRREFFIIFLSIVLIWAFVIVPFLVGFLFDNYPFLEALALVNPIGLVRVVLLAVLFIIITYPSSSALQEYKFRDWELILSCDVDTKQILAGKFIGKLPSFCLLLLALLPFLISFLDAAFRISLAGQLLIYAEITAFSICTYGLSIVIWSGIQARLNQSLRGDFYAKVISVALILPVAFAYGLMAFLEQLTGIMESGLLLLLPSTWSGDLAAWIILQNNASISPSALPLGPEPLTILLGCYGLGILFIGFFFTDRVFTIALGARLESHKTMGKENFFLRFVRRIWPGYWGSLVATSFKHIYRKPENNGKIVYACAASILPVLIFPILAISAPTKPPPDFVLLLSFLSMLMVFPLVGALMFGGIGFFENKYQLWVIQDAPDGVKLFTTGRLAAYAVSAAFLAAVPTIGIGIFYSSQPLVAVILYGCAFALTMAGTLQGMGIASINPAYEDEISPPLNILVTSVTAWGLPFVLLFVGLPSISPIINTYFSGAIALLVSIVLSIILPLLLVGLVLFYIGMKNLMRTSK